MSLEIIKPGLLTTVQDMGRYGYQKDGMLVSGAMDKVALRIGNLLACNAETAAALEITMSGPRIRFTGDHLIAITGADLSATINGVPVKTWRPVFAARGSILEFGAPVTGCRSYLAVAGGLDVPKVLGSCATYLRAGIGGFQGRALQAGDNIPVNEADDCFASYQQALKDKNGHGDHTQASWTIDPKLYPTYRDFPTIRALRGPEYSLFTRESKGQCWEKEFKVSLQSDRMGYRLQGNILSLEQEVNLLSSAVTFGTVQVPPEGHPIVLMADHQTTGGYPRIAQVITADLPKLAQVMPGKRIRFTEVTMEEAHKLYLHQEQTIEKIKQSIHLKMS